MKLVRVTLLAVAASLLLAACGNQAIERDAQYQMGDFAVTENAEFGVSATEVTAEEEGVEQVIVDIMVVNNSPEIFNVDRLDLNYYTPTGEELEYTSVEDAGENYLLPGGNTLATLLLDYTEDGTYYLSFRDTDDKEALYAIEVKKGELIEKALPEVTNTASADLASNVEKGVVSGLGDLEFTFGDKATYTLTTGYGMNLPYVGVELTIKNTGSSTVNFDEYSFYQIYTYQDNTVGFSSVMKQLGSDDDDVLEIGEISTLRAGDSKTVTLMLSSPSSDKDIFGKYIEITYDGEKITYKL